MSGVDRIVQEDELRAVWPYLARSAGRAEWRHLSNNSSYLEAIFDDVTSVARPGGSHSSGNAPVKAAIGPNHVEIAELTASISLLTRSLEVASRERDAERVAREKSEAALETARKGGTDANNETRRLRAANEKLKTQMDDLKATARNASRPLPTIEIHLDGKKFASQRAIRPELWKGLEQAAQLALRHPTASIAESRRTLEIAIGLLWQEITKSPTEGRRVSDLLEELRGHPLLPAGDWHLGKNLYGRASAIIHGAGSSRADLALWVYFGVVQFCELVPSGD
jgi:hypothetical protein